MSAMMCACEPWSVPVGHLGQCWRDLCCLSLPFRSGWTHMSGKPDTGGGRFMFMFCNPNAGRGEKLAIGIKIRAHRTVKTKAKTYDYHFYCQPDWFSTIHPVLGFAYVFLGLLLLSPVYASLTCTFVLTPLPRRGWPKPILSRWEGFRRPDCGFSWISDLLSVLIDRNESHAIDLVRGLHSFAWRCATCVFLVMWAKWMQGNCYYYILCICECVYLTLFCFYPSLTKKGIRFQMRLSAMVLVAETRGTIRNGSACVVWLAFCAGSYFPMRLKSLFVSELGFMISWW